MSTTTAPPDLAERLRPLRVGVRRDLEVSRHVFRGEPAYVVRDPITFQSHRVSPHDYKVLASIDASQTLGETFDGLKAQGDVAPDQEQDFFEFVFSLHRLGFLRLPVSDDRLLYQRYQARQRARRWKSILGILFLQIPLFNPDAFLGRTLPAARWLFTRTFFLIWLCLIGAAAGVAAANWRALAEPINGLLAAGNLPVLWFTLIGLKIFHEFGHAYACKRFGGHVPEMGAYLILFTPCAYVDATAAWGFPRRIERLIVSLAGVYVELAIAAVAVFVWALTGPSLLNSVAYNVIFLASSVTLLFNINPLMRYDGYYVLSDLLEIPNLRQRASDYVAAVAKRLTLGLRDSNPRAPLAERAALLVFGVSAAVYRTVLMVAIVAVLAWKVPVVGLGIGVAMVGLTLYGLVRKLTRLLWWAPETAPVRGRAIALSIVLFAALPAGVLFVPLPGTVEAAGVIGSASESVVRAERAGFVDCLDFMPGQEVHAGKVLLTLRDTTLDQAAAEAEAAVRVARLRCEALTALDAAAAQQEREKLAAAEAELARIRERQDQLVCRAPQDGVVVAGLRDADRGRFVTPGQPLVTIAGGGWQVRAALTTEQMAATKLDAPSDVEFRPKNRPDTSIAGVVRLARPSASRVVELAALTHAAGGNIAVDPLTGEAAQAYVELLVDLEPGDDALRHGASGTLRLPARAEPLAATLYRSVLRFLQRLVQA